MKSITVAGGNLYEIAASELGDASQWIRIAQLNPGLWPDWPPDPFLSGVVNLLIPDPDLRQLGLGIPQQ